MAEIIENNKYFIVYDTRLEKFDMASGIEIKQFKTRFDILTSPSGVKLGSFDKTLVASTLIDIRANLKTAPKIVYNNRTDLINLIASYETKFR